jgi:hypothetical protein
VTWDSRTEHWKTGWRLWPQCSNDVRLTSCNTGVASVVGFQFKLDALYNNLLEPCTSAL